MRLFLSACVLFFSSVVSSATLHNMVVFGDSLSDNGNFYEHEQHRLPLSPPYYQGRFTNGPVWIENLVAFYFPENSSDHLLDYAFAAAAVVEDDEDLFFTLNSEVDRYLLEHHNQADAQNLYVMWVGANNYLGLPDDYETVVHEVNDGIKKNIERLVAKGAQHFLILNLPNLGHIPEAREPEVAKEMARSSKRNNVILNETLEALKIEHPAVEWLFFDVEAAMDEMLENPARNGFLNVKETCWQSALDEEPSSKLVLNIAATIKLDSKQKACDGFLFFDTVHPTGLAHRILAERMRELLDDAGVKFGS